MPRLTSRWLLKISSEETPQPFQASSVRALSFLQLPSGYIHLLHHGLLHRHWSLLQHGIHGLQGENLLYYGLLQRLQGTSAPVPGAPPPSVTLVSVQLFISWFFITLSHSCCSVPFCPSLGMFPEVSLALLIGSTWNTGRTILKHLKLALLGRVAPNLSIPKPLCYQNLAALGSFCTLLN